MLGDRRTHTEASAVGGEEVPQRLEFGGELAGEVGVPGLCGAGDREHRLGQGAPDRGEPPIAAGEEAIGAVRVDGDADRRALRGRLPDVGDPLRPLPRGQGQAGDLDRGNAVELAQPSVEVGREREVRRPRIVVDDDGQVRRRGDGAEELDDLVRGERVVADRGEEEC